MHPLKVARRITSAAIVAAWMILAPSSVWCDELADRLEPHVGQTLDLVELGTGRRFVRPTLEGVVAMKGRATALRLRAEGEKNVTSVSLSVARMADHATAPWPQLSAAEHAAEVEALRRFVGEVQAAFPALALTETHEFLVASDIPAAQLAPYVASLDAMHDFLCDLYGIPRGEPLWKGKCLVVAFLREDDYVAFEGKFMQANTRGTHGMCHQRSDGRVVMACHRGDDPAAFAHMLVHETSHGFNHRWMSPEKLPNWLNEGIAEWVGARVVKNCDQVPRKEAHALVAMRTTGDLGSDFFTAANIQPLQYGMASGLVRMLVSRDARKFATLVRSIKEGIPAEEALRQSFGGSLDDLVRAYGAAVGLPHLRQSPK